MHGCRRRVFIVVSHVEVVCLFRDTLHVHGVGAEEIGVDFVPELGGEPEEVGLVLCGGRARCDS